MDPFRSVSLYFRTLADRGLLENSFLIVDNSIFKLIDCCGGVSFLQDIGVQRVIQFEKQLKEPNHAVFSFDSLPYQINQETILNFESVRIVLLLSSPFESIQYDIQSFISLYPEIQDIVILLTDYSNLNTSEELNTFIMDKPNQINQLYSLFETTCPTHVVIKSVPFPLLPLFSANSLGISLFTNSNINDQTILPIRTKDIISSSSGINLYSNTITSKDLKIQKQLDMEYISSSILRSLQFLNINIKNHIFGVGPSGRVIAQDIGIRYPTLSLSADTIAASLIVVDRNINIDLSLQEDDAIHKHILMNIDQPYSDSTVTVKYVIPGPIRPSLSNLYNSISIYNKDIQGDNSILKLSNLILKKIFKDEHLKMESNPNPMGILTQNLDKLKKNIKLYTKYAETISVLTRIQSMSTSNSYNYKSMDEEQDQYEKNESALSYILPFLINKSKDQKHIPFKYIYRSILRAYTHYPIVNPSDNGIYTDEDDVKRSLILYLIQTPKEYIHEYSPYLMKEEYDIVEDYAQTLNKSLIDHVESIYKNMVNTLFSMCLDLYYARASMKNKCYTNPDSSLFECLLDHTLKESQGNDLFWYNETKKQDKSSSLSYFTSFLSNIVTTSNVQDNSVLYIYIVGGMTTIEIFDFVQYCIHHQNDTQKQTIIVGTTHIIDEDANNHYFQ
ncbi:hypothetical protein WA158_001210 [Blastocystis sp. Blastoise]